MRVIRQFVHGWCSSFLCKLLERCQYVRVQRAALAPQKVRIHRLSRKRMSKREPVLRILHYQLRRDQLLHDRKQLTLLDAQNRAQQRKVKPASGDCRHLKGVSRWFAEAVHPTLNRILYGARDSNSACLEPV